MFQPDAFRPEKLGYSILLEYAAGLRIAKYARLETGLLDSPVTFTNPNCLISFIWLVVSA